MFHRLRNLRQDHDLTQSQLAQLLNMSQTGYSKYETGENDIPTTVLIHLATLYGTSVDFILGITDDTRSYERTKQQDILYREYQNKLNICLSAKDPDPHS